MASELKVDKFTGVTTAGSILVTGEGNSTTTNLQQGLLNGLQYDMGCFNCLWMTVLMLHLHTDDGTGNYNL